MGLSPGEADPFFETNKVARSDGGRDDMEVSHAPGRNTTVGTPLLTDY